MNIRDVLSRDLANVSLQATNKGEAIEELIALFAKAGIIYDQDVFTEAIYFREKEGITGMGDGIAIPHGQSSTVLRPAVAIGLLKEPIEWESYDKEPVTLVVMLAIPSGTENAKTHLKLLAKLSTQLADSERVEKIKTATTYEQLLDLLS